MLPCTMSLIIWIAKMKRRISQLLVSLAKWIAPSCQEDVFEEKTGYEMKVCACAIGIDKRYIRRMVKSEHISSRRKAIEIAKKREIEVAKRAVFASIERHILETRTYLKDGCVVVEARVNCYVAKKD